jgi:diacylglycerol kinase (CTP)
MLLVLGVPLWKIPLYMIFVVGVSVVMGIIGRLEMKRGGFSDKTDWHLARKLQHVLSGVSILFLLQHHIPDSSHAVFLLLFSSAFIPLFYRLRTLSASFDSLFLSVFRPIMRKTETHSLPGAFFFLVGCALALLTCPRGVAEVSIVCLSVGDPAASLAGLALGARSARGKKTLQGAAGCLAASAVALKAFGYVQDWPSALLAGLAASAVELSSTFFFSLDDNLTLPLATGLILSLLAKNGHF